MNRLVAVIFDVREVDLNHVVWSFSNMGGLMPAPVRIFPVYFFGFDDAEGLTRNPFSFDRSENFRQYSILHHAIVFNDYLMDFDCKRDVDSKEVNRV